MEVLVSAWPSALGWHSEWHFLHIWETWGTAGMGHLRKPFAFNCVGTLGGAGVTFLVLHSCSFKCAHLNQFFFLLGWQLPHLTFVSPQQCLRLVNNLGMLDCPLIKAAEQSKSWMWSFSISTQKSDSVQMRAFKRCSIQRHAKYSFAR